LFPAEPREAVLALLLIMFKLMTVAHLPQTMLPHQQDQFPVNLHIILVHWLVQQLAITELRIATNRNFKKVVIGQGGCSMNAHQDYLFGSQYARPKKSREHYLNF
jgi:hypothetical protein